MALLKILDANKKEFNIDVSKVIGNLTEDMSSEVNQSYFNGNDNKVDTSKKVNLTIVDFNGNPYTFDIADSKSIEDIVDIDVYIEASHSDVEINSAFYTGDSMLRDAQTYTSPYRKPFIKNHDNKSEPMGRIMESDCIDSALIDGSKAINVVVKVSDKEAIQKFLDGRYSTVSIGASPRTISCNHCGKHILKDGKFKFCGHWRGETYDDKTCTWKMEDLDYRELSIVNNPADDMAQVYKIKVNTKESLNASNSSKSSGCDIADDIYNAINNPSDTSSQDENEGGIVSVSTNGLILNDDNSEGVTVEDDTNYKELYEECKIKYDEAQDRIALLTVDNNFLSERVSAISNMFISVLKQGMSKFDNTVDVDALSFTEIYNAFRIKLNEYKSVDNVQKSNVRSVDNPGMVNNFGDVGSNNEQSEDDKNNVTNQKDDNNSINGVNYLDALYKKYR